MIAKDYSHIRLVRENPERVVDITHYNPPYGGVAILDDQVEPFYFDMDQKFVPHNLPMQPSGLVGKPVVISSEWSSRTWLGGASVAVVSRERRRKLTNSGQISYEFEFLGKPLLWFPMCFTNEGREYMETIGMGRLIRRF